MQEPKTWDDIETFDDILSFELKDAIFDLDNERETRCPHLKKEGEIFYYCALNMPEVEDKTPSPSHPIYQRSVGLTELDMYCMGNPETCCFKTGKLKR